MISVKDKVRNLVNNPMDQACMKIHKRVTNEVENQISHTLSVLVYDYVNSNYWNQVTDQIWDELDGIG
jgi:hypothetical protein